MTTTDKVNSVISGGTKLISDNAAMVQYKTLTGQEIKLSPSLVRKYLVNGEGQVTDQEVMMFMSLCKYQNLNPFLREAYLIKYGSEKATMVVGKETFLKRAMKNPKYKGHEVGISDDGNKAWAKVYVDGYNVPITCEVDYNEYVGLKDEYVDGKKTGHKIPNHIWATKKRTMLKKVALLQSLREAFPEDLGGMYGQEEISHIQELPTQEIKLDEDVPDFTPPLPMETASALIDSVLPITEADIEVDKKDNGKQELKINETVRIVKGLVVGLVNKTDKHPCRMNVQGIKLTTFSNTVAKNAQAAIDKGLKVEVVYIQSGDYKNIKTLTLLEPADNLRDWQKEFEEAPNSDLLNYLWMDFEATDPKPEYVVQMRRIRDRKMSGWKSKGGV